MKTIRIACLFLTLFGSAGCHRLDTRPQESAIQFEGKIVMSLEQSQAAHLEYGSASVRILPKTIQVSGRVTFDDQRLVHMFSPLTGRVTRVCAGLGQSVRAGDKLAEIISPDLGQFSSDLDKAKADYTAAEHEYKRQQELDALQAGAKRDLEAAEDNFRKAKAEMERALEKTKMLDAGSVDRTTQAYTFRSPIDGEIVGRAISPGTEVIGLYSGGGTPVELFTIGNLDPIWLLADIYEQDLPSIRKGEQIHIKVVAYPDEDFQARIDWIATSLDPQTRTLRIRCVIRNEARHLRPEMYATVSIPTGGSKVLTVPREALLRLGQQYVVFVRLQDSSGKFRFEQRPVQVDEDPDLVHGEYAAIGRGVSDGETVVTTGALLLSQIGESR
jgi:membrane fusion protein, heavy metal efflux system